jgi:RNA polymerase sigma-70 factor (ECF subfamily)
MRLTAVLREHPAAKTPATDALAALMSLHAGRLPGRLDTSGNLLSLSDQDRSRWDRALLDDGIRLLELAARGREVSEYHLEAAIAAVHARTARPEDTDWKTIVTLYDARMAIRPSPIVALNRAIAVAQSEGPERGLEEIGSIEDRDRLTAYPFFPAAIGELELRLGKNDTARLRFQDAVALARNPAERRYLEQRVVACGTVTMTS